MSVMTAPEIPTAQYTPRPRASARGAMYPRPLVFVHIPKAAGTTLAEIIVRQYMGGRGYRFTGDTQQWEDFKNAPKAENGKYDVLHGHVHYGVHEYLPEPATYITMLRDPIDRVVSHYHFVLANPEHYLHQKIAGRRFTLHDYAVTRASHELDNDQVRWLCSRHHFDVPVGQVSREMVEEAKWNLANGFAVVGLMERFAESLACMARAFGWEGVVPPARRNVNKERPPLDQIAPETINAIREINRYDAELYDYALALFEEQMVRLGVPREAPAPPVDPLPG